MILHNMNKFLREKFQESLRPSVSNFELSLKSMPLGLFNARILNRDFTSAYTSEVLDSESGRFLGQQVLTLESPVVRICTTCFNNTGFYIFLTQCTYIWVSCDSDNKQRLFPQHH
jgi:hypothetical protein